MEKVEGKKTNLIGSIFGGMDDEDFYKVIRAEVQRRKMDALITVRTDEFEAVVCSAKGKPAFVDLLRLFFSQLKPHMLNTIAIELLPALIEHSDYELSDIDRAMLNELRGVVGEDNDE
jgi:hypothetical protein